MTAHVIDEQKRAAARKAQRTMQERENPRSRRGRVAEQMVRGWSPEQRARIRDICMELRWFGGGCGELELAALIDQVSAEEA